MTEAQWLAHLSPVAMLDWLRGDTEFTRMNDRTLRLIAVACCRSIWPHFAYESSRRAVEVAELFADGLATRRDLETAWLATSRRTWDAAREVVWAGLGVEAWGSAREAVWKAMRVGQASGQAALLRDIVGNPFRPVTLPLRSPWLTQQVVSLATAAYDHRDPATGHLDPVRLAILADALEEVGCDSEPILAHLRSPGPHVRGCWPIDLILGK